MNGNKKGTILFALFALIVIFADELFLGTLALTGTAVESGMKGRMAMVIALFAYVLLLVDLLRYKLLKSNITQLLVLFIILFLFYFTREFYPYNAEANSHFVSYFLSYGATSIPACIVGMHMARGNFEPAIIKYLPYFTFVIVAIVGYTVFNAYLSGVWLSSNDSNLFNYQNGSYYLSFCYSYCFVSVFFKELKIAPDARWKWWMMIVLMLICVIGCLAAGGRGAFVYLIVITFYLVYRLSQRRGNKHTNSQWLFLIVAISLFLVANSLNVFESSGLGRIIGTLTEDDTRKELWRKALNSFYDSPLIGNGIGSIWWTVGFYSHNMLTDLLSETGIVGTAIVVWALISIFIQLARRSKTSWLDMFVLVVFLGALVQATFSGYWLASPKLFFAYGYVFGLRNPAKSANN